MRCKVSAGLFVLASIAVLARPAAAQLFGLGYVDIGPTVGFGSLGSANMAYGGRFEKAVNGSIGIQVGVSYYSWTAADQYGEFGYTYNYTYIPIGVTANYHFKFADSKLDPFIGAGLGYEIVSCSYRGGCG